MEIDKLMESSPQRTSNLKRFQNKDDQNIDGLHQDSGIPDEKGIEEPCSELQGISQM